MLSHNLPAVLITVGINSQTTPQTVTGPVATLEISGNAANNVSVGIQVNMALLPTGITPLPAGSYSVASTTLSIPSGRKVSDAIKISITNSSLLDPTVTYGIGFSIASVDGGYKIAANQKNVVLAFNIKNQYDGKYRLKTQFYHPTAAPTYPLLVTDQIELITAGPNSVKMNCLIPGLVGYYHPWSTGTSISAFASQEPVYTVNTTTNAVTVQNGFVGAVTFYEMGKGFNNLGYNHRYDPATKTIYANFGYNLSAGQAFNAAASRMWIDTLIYLGPR